MRVACYLSAVTPGQSQLDVLYNCQMKLSLSKPSCAELVKSRFKTPTLVTVEVAVRAGQNARDGGQRVLSGIEHLRAFNVTLRRDLDNGEPEATIAE